MASAAEAGAGLCGGWETCGVNIFKELMRTAVPSPSAWRLGTSRGGEVTAGTPVAKLYVGATGGTLYMGMGSNSIYLPYNYVGAGAGVGLGVSPPVNASFSTTDFPSSGGEWGRVYMPPALLAQVDMTQDTISGPATLINPGLQWCAVGAGISIILFGVSPNVLNWGNPLALFNQTKGVAFQAGLSAITPSVGVGCTVYSLTIMGAGKAQRM